MARRYRQRRRLQSKTHTAQTLPSATSAHNSKVSVLGYHIIVGVGGMEVSTGTGGDGVSGVTFLAGLTCSGID
jgi:hypothetical protein